MKESDVMYTDNKKNGRLAAVLLIAVLFVCVALPVGAQDAALPDLTIADDTLSVEADQAPAVDSAAFAYQPEWYVAPVIPETKRAPKHAKAAKCSLDSTLSFDVDSVLVEVSEFKYDDADRVTSETVYACNPDGSRVGTFKEDYGFDANGTQVMTAVYEWVSASSKWKGTEKMEFAYDGEQMIQRIDYAWVSEAWVADKKNTWKYDDQERVPEYHEYTRDKNTNQLVDSKARIQEWDAEDRQITDIQYTAYSNGAWTAGTKKEWGYDTNGNKTKYIYYAGLTNGNWGATGSTRELWTYDGSNTKTKYEKYTWSNGWVGSQKDEWGYTDGKQTMYAKYAWSNGDWVGVSKEEWNYTAGKQTLYAKYTWQNGAWVGVSKEEWEYTSGKDKRHEKFTWSNGAWQTTEREDWTYNGKGKETLYEKQSLESGSLVIAARRASEYDGSNNQTLLANYSRKNGALVGTTKETWAYTSGKMTKHNKFVWGSSDWTDSEEEVWAYSGSNETNYEKYAWESGVKTGKTKRTSEYTSGKKTQQIDWAWESGAWVNSDKEVWTYTSGKLTLNEKYNWVNGAWAYTLREVWAYDGSNQTLHEKYTGENGALVGEEKEVWAYASGKLTLHEVYMWHNSAWAVLSRKEYDDSDREILIEMYTITSGIYTGTKKEEYTFNAAGKTTEKKTYKWQSGAWQKDTRYVANYDAAGRKTLECSYTGQNNEWKGKSQCLLWTYDSSDRVIDYITQVWSTKKKDWVNNERIATTYYSGDNPLKETYYVWENDAWVEVSWTDYAYNSAGENESVKAYEFDGTSWVCVSRITNSFNSNGVKILSVNEYWDWDTENWIIDSKEKRDIIYDSEGRLLLDARWTCGSDLKWKGVKKDTAAYNAIGKKIFEAQYTSWKNNNWVPSYKIEAEYDEAGRTLWEQKLNWKDNKWSGQYRNEYNWDDQGRQILYAYYATYYADADLWLGITREEYTYAPNGERMLSTTYVWDNDHWTGNTKFTYVYDSSNREIERLEQSFYTNKWVNSQRYIKEYNGSKLIKSNEYVWKNNQWIYRVRNEWYYDSDSQAKLRRVIAGTWNSGVVQSYTDDHHFYACDPHYFTIRFVDEDGTLLESDKVKEGEVPVYGGDTPTKAGNAQYSYTFKGWDKALVAATAHATYTATYTQTVNKYTITFLNDNGATIESKQWEYGATPTCAEPTKAATDEYVYTFAGWEPSVAAVTGDATYTATFTTEANLFTITWVDGDGKTLKTEKVAYGVTPAYTGATPTKSETAQYTYAFNNIWLPTIVAVTADATYTAQFGSTVRSYTVTYLDDADEEIDQEILEYGAMPEPETPTKTSTAQYTYTFAGWTPAITNVTGAATYTATYTSVVNKYTITWVNDDNTLIDQTVVEYGTVPTHADATKENTAEYTYTFAGWDNTIVAVMGEATYKATFTSTLNKYLITFQNEDGSVIEAKEYEYGATPVAPADPTKGATAQYTYTFSGWDNTPVAVTGDATYKATFTSTLNKYLITFQNEDGSTIEAKEYEYGATPVAPTDPTKEATAQYTYTFNGWDNTIVAVTGAATYKATFTATLNKYLITFQNEDGSTIEAKEYEYGATPVAPADPTKDATAQYTYTFSGWDNTIVAVTGAATYKATFTSTLNKYLITFRNEDGSVIEAKEYEYGATPVAPADPTKEATTQYTYTFSGWDNTIVAVTGEVTYKATFEATVNSYIITWVDEDGVTVLYEGEFEYGSMPEYGGADPAKEATAEYTYSFAGWTPEVVEVVGTATYTATYTATIFTGLDNAANNQAAVKVVENGIVYIVRAGKKYAITGVAVE